MHSLVRVSVATEKIESHDFMIDNDRLKVRIRIRIHCPGWLVMIERFANRGKCIQND